MTQLAGKVTVRVEARREKALALRIEGHTYLAIAAKLSISKSRAHDLVQQALTELKERNLEQAEQVRDIEVARLDEMVKALWKKRGNPRAADSILRIAQRRSDLYGLDAPKRTEMSGPNGAPLVPPGAIAITLVAPPDSSNVPTG